MRRSEEKESSSDMKCAGFGINPIALSHQPISPEDMVNKSFPSLHITSQSTYWTALASTMLHSMDLQVLPSKDD